MRTHQAAQHREVPDELAVVEPVRRRNVLEHLCIHSKENCVLHHLILPQGDAVYSAEANQCGEPSARPNPLLNSISMPNYCGGPVRLGAGDCTALL